MTFAVYINQNGEGCDYTIGCGQTLTRLSATTREEAIEEAKALYMDEGNPGEGRYGNEREYASMTLVEIAHELPVKAWAAEYRQAAAARAAAKKEEAERAEYERLKKQFG